MIRTVTATLLIASFATHVQANTFNLANGVLTEARISNARSHSTDSEDPAYNSQFSTYDYLGLFLQPEGRYISGSRSIEDRVSESIDFSGSYDGAGAEETSNETIVGDVVFSFKNARKVDAGTGQSSVSVLGTDLTLDEPLDYRVVQSVITQAGTVQADQNFFGLYAQVSSSEPSDTIFLDIPTFERTIFWSSNCCYNPATFRVETDAETIHRFGLSDFSLRANLKEEPSDLTAVDLTKLTKDDVEGPLELYLSFRDMAPGLRDSGARSIGSISLTYAFELPEAEQLTAVPVPASLPLLLVGCLAMACIGRRRNRSSFLRDA
jgi:hypothetical protein